MEKIIVTSLVILFVVIPIIIRILQTIKDNKKTT